jgi:hypothetical protein
VFQNVLKLDRSKIWHIFRGLPVALPTILTLDPSWLQGGRQSWTTCWIQWPSDSTDFQGTILSTGTLSTFKVHLDIKYTAASFMALYLCCMYIPAYLKNNQAVWIWFQNKLFMPIEAQLFVAVVVFWTVWRYSKYILLRMYFVMCPSMYTIIMVKYLLHSSDFNKIHHVHYIVHCLFLIEKPFQMKRISFSPIPTLPPTSTYDVCIIKNQFVLFNSNSIKGGGWKIDVYGARKNSSTFMV